MIYATIKKFAVRQTQRDGNLHRHRSPNSSLDSYVCILFVKFWKNNLPNFNFFVPLCCLILLFLRRSVEVWHKKSPISHRNPKKLVDGQQQKFCHGENCHLSKDCIFTRGSNSRLVSELLCLNAEHNDWDIYRYCYFWVVVKRLLC